MTTRSVNLAPLDGLARQTSSTFDKKRRGLLPGAAIRHVLADKRVNMLAIGMRLKGEIDANIKTLSGKVAFTAADQALLEEFGEQALKSDAMKKMKVE